MTILSRLARRGIRFSLLILAAASFYKNVLLSPPTGSDFIQHNGKQQQTSVTTAQQLDQATSDETKRKPNILLLFLDQWRYDWDGFHSSPTGPIPLKLPFYTSMASEGTRFTQAYVPSPICGPVRACLACGREFDESGMTRNHADDFPTNTTTFYKLMRDVAGYHVMTCGKDDLFKGDVNFPYFPGVNYSRRDGWMDLGFSDAIRTLGKAKVIKIKQNFDPYRKFLEETLVLLPDGTQVKAIDAFRDCSEGKIIPGSSNCESLSFTEELYPDTYVQRNAITLLDRKPRDKPWFLQVNFPGPHPPFLTTKDMAESVVDREWPLPYDAENIDPICPQQEMRNNGQEFGPQKDGRCNYGAQIEHIDSLIHQTINHLDRKELDNTLVCITGDHGEMLGDHDQQAKAKPWQGAISVPLLCFGPGVKKGSIYADPVTTLDLPGTFLDYAGYGKAPYPMTTRSLRHLLQDENKRYAKMFENKELEYVPPVREYVSSGYGNWRAVIKVTSGKHSDTSIQHLSTYKLICCRGTCPEAPKSATPVSSRGWNILLYDTIADPFDMLPLEEDLPSIVEEMMPLLPDGWCVGNLDSGDHTT